MRPVNTVIFKSLFFKSHKNKIIVKHHTHPLSKCTHLLVLPTSDRQNVALVILPNQIFQDRSVVKKRVQLIGLHRLETLLHSASIKTERGKKMQKFENGSLNSMS